MDIDCYTKPISELRDMFNLGVLELDPPYQRKSVWRTKQRRNLLYSIFNGIPIPSIILSRKYDSNLNKHIYNVLDGKQRIETILHFIKVKRLKNEDKLYVEFPNPKTNKTHRLFYEDLNNRRKEEFKKLSERFWGYELSFIEYEEDITDFFDNLVADFEVFVRINSTGSSLTKGEIRHAQYSNSFSRLGSKLEKRNYRLFRDKLKIVTQREIDRYQFNEFIMELSAGIYDNSYSDRRKRIDEYLGKRIWANRDIKIIESRFKKIINWIKKIFPGESIKPTRFKNKSDFYSLFLVLLKLYNDGYLIDVQRSNKLAKEFLINFSRQIIKIQNKSNTEDLSIPEIKLQEYINATRHSTDTKKNREIRHNYLMGVLKDGIFIKKKDQKRIFTKNDKDLLWLNLMNHSKRLNCPNPLKNRKCKRILSYDDAEVDHKWAHSKGGPTTLQNAQLLCSSCNPHKRNK